MDAERRGRMQRWLVIDEPDGATNAKSAIDRRQPDCLSAGQPNAVGVVPRLGRMLSLLQRARSGLSGLCERDLQRTISQYLHKGPIRLLPGGGLNAARDRVSHLSRA